MIPADFPQLKRGLQSSDSGLEAQVANTATAEPFNPPSPPLQLRNKLSRSLWGAKHDLPHLSGRKNGAVALLRVTALVTKHSLGTSQRKNNLWRLTVSEEFQSVLVERV